MPKNHDRTIVQRSRIVRHRVHCAFQRRVHGSARRHEYIYAQVNRAPLTGGMIIGAELAAMCNKGELRCSGPTPALAWAFFISQKSFSVAAAMSVAAGSPPSVVLPTLKSKSHGSRIAKIDVQQRRSWNPIAMDSHLLTAALCGTAGRPHASRNV